MARLYEVTHHDEAYVRLRFNYDPAVVAELKCELLPHARRWEPSLQAWIVTRRALPHVEQILERHGYTEYKAQQKRERPEQPASKGPWRELWLIEGAPREVIVAAYRALCRIHHPDVGGDQEVMKRINLAYEAIQKVQR